MLGKEETWLLKEKYHGEKTASFFTDCARLKSGEPLAYIIGYLPFLDCQIWLDSKPLIPRTETEFWVAQLIKEIRKNHPPAPLKILDLCAGSGCIGVAIAKALPEATVDFIELDPAHLKIIKKNCQGNNLSVNRVRIFASNLFEILPKSNQYDFIVSNPPYIDPNLDRTESSVKGFEPHLALYGGTLGLQLIRTIIKDALSYLSPTGQLWLEHEPEQTDEIHNLGNDNYIVTTNQDQYQHDRYSVLVLK